MWLYRGEIRTPAPIFKQALMKRGIHIQLKTLQGPKIIPKFNRPRPTKGKGRISTIPRGLDFIKQQSIDSVCKKTN